MIHKDYCSKCKRKNIPLIKYSKGAGGKTQYYYCRSCTNEKMSRYIKKSNGLKNMSEVAKKTNSKYPEKLKARQAIARALKSGKLTKPELCEACGSSGRIEGHHMDYAERLKVLWLCPPCHSIHHSNNDGRISL